MLDGVPGEDVKVLFKQPRHQELPAHRLFGPLPDRLPAPGDEVWGALWLIDATESRPLDEQEGLFRDPPAYRRVTVEVTTAAGDVVR